MISAPTTQRAERRRFTIQEVGRYFCAVLQIHDEQRMQKTAGAVKKND